MTKLKRHAAVFCLVLAAAALASFLAPMDVNSRDVFFLFLVGFFFYLGFSALWPVKGRRDDAV